MLGDLDIFLLGGGGGDLSSSMRRLSLEGRDLCISMWSGDLDLRESDRDFFGLGGECEGDLYLDRWGLAGGGDCETDFDPDLGRRLRCGERERAARGGGGGDSEGVLRLCGSLTARRGGGSGEAVGDRRLVTLTLRGGEGEGEGERCLG